MDTRWFGHVQSEFAGYVTSFAGKPVAYLEIGTWEGASMLWMLDNVLTHPEATAISIDPYIGEHRHSQAEQDQRYKDVYLLLHPSPKWNIRRERSDVALRTMSHYRFDIAYIDGRHNAAGALEDFVLLFPLMRPGGVVIFDDYGIGQRKNFPHVPAAVAAVELAYAGMVEPLPGRSKQAAFRVTGKEQHP